jgi:hypothetical protein
MSYQHKHFILGSRLLGKEKIGAMQQSLEKAPRFWKKPVLKGF